MNLKNIVSVSTIILASAALGFAEEAPKEINALIGNASIGEIVKNFSFSATADYESEFIFRGKQLAERTIAPQVDVGYDFGSGFAAYAGWWGCFSTDDTAGSYKENDLYARVKIQDSIGETIGIRHAIAFAGERPGLGSPDSLSAYFTYKPRWRTVESDRNCVSNIRPLGLPPKIAAKKLALLLKESLARGISGTQLKDNIDDSALLEPPPKQIG